MIRIDLIVRVILDRIILRGKRIIRVGCEYLSRCIVSQFLKAIMIALENWMRGAVYAVIPS